MAQFKGLYKEDIIAPFIEEISESKIEIYNEFSLQHELGLFIRNKYKNESNEGFKCKVQFERNIKFFNIPQKKVGEKIIKKEIDISVFRDDGSQVDPEPEIAIELKYPRNGQYPEQMFKFCEDIKFCEQLKINGFKNTFVMIVVDDKLFYEKPFKNPKPQKKIYSYFRDGEKLTGEIEKPTGFIKKDTIKINGEYTIKWETINEDTNKKCRKYAFIEIQ